MGIPIRHPLVDEITPHAVRIDSRAPVVRLSPPLADVLSRPSPGPRRFVLVTPETSGLTIGLRSALVAADGVWAVTTATGFRDGITGIERATVDDAARALEPALDPEVGAESSSRAHASAPTTQLSVDVTLLHEQSHDTLLGGALEALVGAVAGTKPLVWGRTEPLEHPWDRWVVTQDARHRAPALSRILVEGAHLSAAVTTRVVADGIEETIAVTIDVPGGGQGLDGAITRLEAALVDLTRTAVPTFALVLARVGEPDRCLRPVEYPPPNPVALLIGSPSVTRLDLDVGVFAAEQDVVVAGRPTEPAYLLPLGNATSSGWDKLTDALDSVGGERLMTVVDDPLRQAWEDDLGGDLDLEGEPHPHSHDGASPHAS